ncbi:alcohol dehydrogenase [Halalkalibacter wakoensis JCM 9140]|uniref:Alcohol dehydrogenase n=1 Tax=Halalkalibacter wakoensis JCM 9140 TaxID=1236970 RepID=W4Q8Z6_9BACI|nr:iron-containing alcohol dehydrogenase [Halalkalibacter wakoensis]GAE28158.1 alcohol dehydrogenase [Halalkalibacter wakoensis JCM 9140]
MNLFEFDLPTKIKAGVGTFHQTAQYIKDLEAAGKRLFIVTDPGIIKIGLAEKLENALTEQGFITKTFSDVKPNPRDVDCIKGGDAARAFEADCIIALGGGSVIDAAKAIAILHVLGKRPQDYAGRGNIPKQVTPLVAIPTTAGTGAEVTRSSVITDTEKKIKFTIKDVKIAPAIAVVDPELTYKLPPLLTASTGMDALVHAIEAYTCKLSNPIADGLALEAIRRIYPALRTAVQNGENHEARYELMIGATIAGIAFSHADVASVHCMAEAIGGLYDTPHGIANSMFLPYIIEYNASADLKKHATIARTIGIAADHDTDENATKALVHEMKQLAKDIEIPTFASLSQVKRSDFDYLAESAFKNGSTPSNARTITKDDYLMLFTQAYGEKKQ